MNRPNKLPNIRQQAVLALNRIEEDHAYTDLILNSILIKNNFNDLDRAFLSELVRGTVRWKKKLDWIVTQLLRNPDMAPASVKRILWLGLYQIIYMSKTPDFAAVNESVELAKHTVHEKWGKVVNGVLRTFIRNQDSIKYPDPEAEPVKYLAITRSYPEWMISRWLNQFGYEQTCLLCDAFNERPVLAVRVNQLKLSIADFEQSLTLQQISFVKGQVPGFYRLHDTQAKVVQQLLESGKITVQDESAGLVALLAAPLPGQVVFDLCAAPGGKAMHVAELAGDHLLILAGDVNTARTRLIRNAANRLGISSVFPLVANAANFPAGEADIVFLDAPCSGMGVLHKKPDLRWQRTLENITELLVIQTRLLTAAAGYVKKGGFLIYSTCTIDLDENENLVPSFLKQNPNFSLCKPDPARIPATFITNEYFIRTWPHEHKMDGGFAVKFQKNGN